jgi:hypothetical protein
MQDLGALESLSKCSITGNPETDNLTQKALSARYLIQNLPFANANEQIWTNRGIQERELHI